MSKRPVVNDRRSSLRGRGKRGSSVLTGTKSSLLTVPTGRIIDMFITDFRYTKK